MTEAERVIFLQQLEVALTHYVKLYTEWDAFHRRSLWLGGHRDIESMDIHDVVLERMSRPLVVKTWMKLVAPAPCVLAGGK